MLASTTYSTMGESIIAMHVQHVVTTHVDMNYHVANEQSLVMN